jgi:hypothetical protein
LPPELESTVLQGLQLVEVEEELTALLRVPVSELDLELKPLMAPLLMASVQNLQKPPGPGTCPLP